MLNKSPLSGLYHGDLFIHLLKYIHLSCFEVLAVMNKIAVNISAQGFVWT